jgi:predicted esterase/catechol 2,3-dioxygenase-like lactoylglutathione lyase family enzyme
MEKNQAIKGIHHITAVTASAEVNLHFYESVLGLRLVKQTVNFDDPYTYHLYYGDTAGTPGTIITFFPWEDLPQGRPGAGMVAAIAFAVAVGAMDDWRRRLSHHGLSVREGKRFGEPTLSFADPHGLPLELVGVGDTDGGGDPGNRIMGFHSATAVVTDDTAITHLLADTLGMIHVGEEGLRHRFRMDEGVGVGRYYDLVVDPAAPMGRPGSGTVHHIAFRTDDDATQALWQQKLRQAGIPATDVRDRKYFRSIYFHTPGGVLFEIATDPPGFAVDEPPETLGSTLQLPAQYERMREDITHRLPKLRSEDFDHVFLPGDGDTRYPRTLVPLHGTGGDEHDLIPLAKRIHPSAAVLSPRGRVLENGMRRFFGRFSDGVFDREDIVRRAADLKAFISGAVERYRLSDHRLTALGYSNGANMAAATLLLHPEVFSSLILLRPMLPLTPEALPDLAGVRVLMITGDRDAIIPSESTDRLEVLLSEAGADVERQRLPVGHELTRSDMDIAARWIAEDAARDCGAACAA